MNNNDYNIQTYLRILTHRVAQGFKPYLKISCHNLSPIEIKIARSKLIRIGLLLMLLVFREQLSNLLTQNHWAHTYLRSNRSPIFHRLPSIENDILYLHLWILSS